MIETIIGWVIGLLVVSLIGAIFSRNYFITFLVTAFASIYCTIISFKFYDQLYLSEFWQIEIQRFVCLYIIVVFNSLEIIKIRNDEEVQTFYFTPNFFYQAGIGALISALILFIADYAIPNWFGGPRTFAIVGWLTAICAIPSVFYLVKDIMKVFRR